MSVEEITQSIIDKAESDGSIDHIMFLEQTDAIVRIANILYGVLSTIILLFVPLVISIEVIYINFPIIRGKIDDLLIKVEGHGIAHRMAGFALGDAVEAVRVACTAETGRSAIYIYLVNKCKSLMFIMFIICLVINGTSDIINYVWSLIENVVLRVFY